MADIDSISKQLTDSIDGITESVNSITESINGISPTSILNIESLFLTDRQVAKKMIAASAPKDRPIDEEAIHFAVYGKITYDDQGKLLDDEIAFPDCVNSDINIMNDNHPFLKSTIPQMKDNVKGAIQNTVTKMAALAKAFASAISEILAGAITAIANISLFPIGTGLPASISAILGILSTVKSLQNQILEIPKIIEPLKDVVYLIPDEELQSTTSLIRTILTTMESTLDKIESLTDKLSFLQGKLQEAKDLAAEAGTSGTSGTSGTGGETGYVNITPQPARLELTFNGFGNQTFNIESSEHWTATNNGDFFDYTPTDGPNGGTITVTGRGEPSLVQLDGVIIVKAGDAQSEIYVIQPARPGGGGGEA